MGSIYMRSFAAGKHNLLKMWLLRFLPMWTMRTIEVSVAMTPERALESPRPLHPGNPEYSL